MNRIIEAFTRAHDQVTGIDQLIMTVITVGVLLMGVALYLIVIAIVGRK